LGVPENHYLPIQNSEEPFLYVGLLIAISSCHPATSYLSVDDLALTYADSAGIEIYSLSHSPNQISEGFGLPEVVAPRFVVGGADSDILSIEDIAALGGGRIAIADGLANRIVLVGPDGGVDGFLGREGDGPGEFRSPYVVEASPSELLVVDATGRVSTFSRPDLSFISRTIQPVPGDWAFLGLRRPFSRWDRQKRQVTIEDITRRYQGYYKGGFLFQVQDDERHVPPGFPFSEPPVSLIKTDRSFTSFDTLSVLVGPPSMRLDQSSLERYPGFTQQTFASRPSWTTGTGWTAVGHGNQNEIQIWCGETTKPCALIRWSPHRRPLRQDEKEAHVEWLFRYEMAIAEGDHLGRLRNLSNREKESLVRRQIEIMEFADSVPHVTDMRGVGNCLFLTGFNPEDTYRGVSATWVAIHLSERRIAAVFRVPGIGRRVREIGDGFLYATHHDEWMAEVMEGLKMPDLSCEFN
jgi:hypothetical protein